jgi:hypothetical protein
MGSPWKKHTVIRHYEAAPDDCARALALLLKKSANKEAAGAGGPDDAKESKVVCTATEKYT